MKKRFQFEELQVWQKAIDFSIAVIDASEKIRTDRKHFRLIEQLEAAAASVALNIAEGKGRYSKKEFIHFLYVARGSLYEAITLLRIFQKKEWIKVKDIMSPENIAEEINKMISSLIASIKESFA